MTRLQDGAAKAGQAFTLARSDHVPEAIPFDARAVAATVAADLGVALESWRTGPAERPAPSPRRAWTPEPAAGARPRSRTARRSGLAAILMVGVAGLALGAGLARLPVTRWLTSHSAPTSTATHAPQTVAVTRAPTEVWPPRAPPTAQVADAGAGTLSAPAPTAAIQQVPLPPAAPPPAPSRVAQSRPGQARPGQARPGQARPGQARPGQARPGQARPGSGAAPRLDLNRLAQAHPGQLRPGQLHPGRAAPAHVNLNRLASSRPAPARSPADIYAFAGSAPPKRLSRPMQGGDRYAAAARLRGRPGLCGGMATYERTLCLNAAMQEADSALRETYQRAVRARVDSETLNDYHDVWMTLRERVNGDPEGTVRGYYRLASQLKAATRHAASASLMSDQ
jgi:hypothetical protein